MMKYLLALAFSLSLAGSNYAAWQNQAGLLPADSKKIASENLNRAYEVVHKTDSGLHLLSRALWVGSVLKKRPDLAGGARTVDQMRGPVKELDGMLARLNSAMKPDATKRESGKFLDKLKTVNLNAQAEVLRKFGKAVEGTPVGLVSEAVDDKFQVTPELLVKKPREAKERFAGLLVAMKTNIDYLKTQQAQLEEIHKRGKAASKALSELNKGIEKAVQTGLFTKPLLEKYLDIDNLIKAYNSLAGDAQKKAKEAKVMAEVQQRRYDNLRHVVSTAFGFKL